MLPSKFCPKENLSTENLSIRNCVQICCSPFPLNVSNGLWSLSVGFFLNFFFWFFRSNEDALKLIEAEPPKSKEKKRSNWQERDMGGILCTVVEMIF